MSVTQAFISATASDVADALNGSSEGYDAFHLADLDGDGIAEIAVEVPATGRRFMLVVKAHWEDE